MATNSAINTESPIEVTKGGTGAATLTDHGILVGSGTGAITPLAVATNGQLIIGATGADPAPASLTSSAGSITVTPSAGGLNLETSGSTLSWSKVTGVEQDITVGSGYIVDNASENDMTLPATASVGAVFAVVAEDTGLFRISQNAGQTIHNGDSDTLTGTLGYLSCDSSHGCVELICTVEDDDWTVRNIVGTFTERNATWTQRTSSFSTTDILGVAYDGSTNYVAVGFTGKLATATDPTGTWTQRTSSFSTDVITRAFYDGSSTWVAVGANAKLATATDPTSTWTQRTSGFSTSDIFDVIYAESIWTAVGQSGKVFTAPDPTSTWTARTSQFSSTDVNGIGYDGDASVWCIVGNTGKMSTAADPDSTWTSRTSSFGTTNINKVHYANGIWVAVGDSGKIATATDATGTWTQASDVDLTGAINDVYYGDGKWTAVSAEGQISTTTNPSGAWPLRTNSFDSGENVMGVTYDGSTYWVAVGTNGELGTATTI